METVGDEGGGQSHVTVEEGGEWFGGKVKWRGFQMDSVFIRVEEIRALNLSQETENQLF